MDSIGPCISIFFPESNSPVTLPVSSVSQSCFVRMFTLFLIGYKLIDSRSTKEFLQSRKTLYFISKSVKLINCFQVIASALNELKSAPAPAPQQTTSQQQQQQQTSTQTVDNTSFYRKQAWIVVQVR